GAGLQPDLGEGGPGIGDAGADLLLRPRPRIGRHHIEPMSEAARRPAAANDAAAHQGDAADLRRLGHFSRPCSGNYRRARRPSFLRASAGVRVRAPMRRTISTARWTSEPLLAWTPR